MRRPLPFSAILLAATLACGTAFAQQSNEDRLREALKRQTAELRAAQDAQASLQAQISDLTHQRDALQQQLDQAKAQLAAKPAAGAAAAKPADDAELSKLKAELDAAHKDVGELQAALTKWQGAYKDAAALAQSRDAEAKRLDAAFKTASQKLDVCRQANTRLIATARTILHLYESQDFRSLLLKSYEPVLGLKRVELENTVQDYDDKIDGAVYREGQTPAGKTSP